MSEDLSDRDNAILNCIFNPNLPLEEAASISEDKLNDEEHLTHEPTKTMEIEAVQLAENGDLSEALIIIDKAIKIAPNRPSLYHNRAHILQYLRRFEDAFQDVTKAIELCTDNHKKTSGLAHCQRGLLHRKFGRVDMARSDFEIAAKLGNQFAKKQLVEINPYAALCNQMLRQVMEKLK